MPAKTPARRNGDDGSGTRGAGADLVSRIGPFEVDLPRSLGFFGGVALAVGAGLIEPPLRFVAQIFEGVAKPVGGDSQGTVRIVTSAGSSDEPVEQDS